MVLTACIFKQLCSDMSMIISTEDAIVNYASLWLEGTP